MKLPIQDSALDDRLGFVGTAGSGKTYNAAGRVERLLDKGARVVIPDPLGVWWGLRLLADGKTQSPYDVAIFGGAHGDLPLTEHAGALIGETVAGMKESCIIDLSALGTKAAERRFMLAFCTALYKHASGEPVHVVFDEADMWAPQRLLDKDGEAAKLLGMMETLVRRGRVKGFIPWLITQRPAVLSKDVLSQIDGLIAFKLTSSQDRAAIGDWIEGQADRAQGKEILASLPTMERGQGVVWIPGRAVLETVSFPPKTTFDSSRTPKRGEKARRSAALKPLDLGALKDRLATIDAETKANDPKALKARIAELEKSLKQTQSTGFQKPAAQVNQVPDRAALAAAEKRGYRRGQIEMLAIGVRSMSDYWSMLIKPISQLKTAFEEKIGIIEAAHMAISDMIDGRAEGAPSLKTVPSEFWNIITGKWPEIKKRIETDSPSALPATAQTARIIAPMPQTARTSSPAMASGDGNLSPALQKVLNAIAWWRKIGVEPVRRERACVVAGYSPKASTFGVYIAELVKQGLVAVQPGTVALTSEGLAQAVTPDAATTEELYEMARGLLGAQQRRIFETVYRAHPDEIHRNQVAEAVGLSPTASTAGVYLADVAAYGIIENGSRSHVRAAGWLFQ